MKHLSENDLILLHYRESKAHSAEAHLADCADCRRNLAELSRVLRSIQPEVDPERSPAYGNEVWNRIRAELPERQPGWRSQVTAWWRQPRAWAVSSAVAALVVAAFMAGRFWPSTTTSVPPAVTNVTQPAPAQVRERVLLVAVGSHLERSQMMLVELSHAPAQDGLDISGQQRRAEELLSANRLYRQTATESGDAKMASLLDQLERVLIDVAHRPSKLSKLDVQDLQRQIESQGLEFKVRVVRSKVRDQLRNPKPQRPAQASPSRQTT